MKLKYPPLKIWQRVAYEYIADSPNAGKVLVIKAKRQVGKNFLASAVLLNYCSYGKINIILEPSLNQCRRVFKQLTKALSRTGLLASCNASTLSIEFKNGAEILFKSAAQGENLRGDTVTGVLIIDEAAFIEDDVIDTILPTIDANNANLMFISTPLFTSGRFYEEYISEAPDKLVLDWTTYDTSCFLSATRLEEYRKKLSPNKFKSEYLGQFITENGLLFNNLEACIGYANETETVYIGIDFCSGSSTGSDYTVISAINQNGEQVFMNRIKNVPPAEQIDWLANIINEAASKWKIGKILAEKNSIGTVYINLLQKKINVHITDWVTTNKSKKKLVDTLQLALEQKRITIIGDEHQLDELRKYQAEINFKTNTVSYNAATGNDDTVIALMLAYYAYQGTFGQYIIGLV